MRVGARATVRSWAARGSHPTARPPAPRQEGQCPVELEDHFSPPDWERPGAGPSGSAFHLQLLLERAGVCSLLRSASEDSLLVPDQSLSVGVRHLRSLPPWTNAAVIRLAVITVS